MEIIMGSKKPNKKKRIAILVAVVIILGFVLFGTATNYLGAIRVKKGLTITDYTADPVENQIAAQDTEDLLVAKFKAQATGEDWTISKLTFAPTDSTGANAATLINDVDSMTLSYEGASSSVTAAKSGSAFIFSGMSILVPTDDSITIELYADLDSHVLDGGSLESDDALYFTLRRNGFKATGTISGEFTTIPTVTTSNATYVYRSIPTVANASSLSTSILTGEQEVYRFTVSADSSYDTILYYMTLDLTQTGLVTGNSTTMSLSKDGDANRTWQVGVCGGTGYYGSRSSTTDTSRSAFQLKEYGKSTILGSGCYDAHNGLVKIELSWSTNSRTSGIVIGQGATKTFSVFANIVEDSSTATTTSLSMRIHQDSTYRAATSMLGLVGTNSTNLAATGLVWSDYGVASGTHGENTAEWMVGYKVPGMPVSYVTLT